MAITVGSFRKELEDVKVLRGKNRDHHTKQLDLLTQSDLIFRSSDIGSQLIFTPEDIDVNIQEQIEISPPLKSHENFDLRPRINLYFKSKLKTNAKSKAHPPETPSNPLLDESIKIIRPTAWIDCISRESRRVFVQDYWIVARILLPLHNDNESGLRNLK